MSLSDQRYSQTLTNSSCCYETAPFFASRVCLLMRAATVSLSAQSWQYSFHKCHCLSMWTYWLNEKSLWLLFFLVKRKGIWWVTWGHSLRLGLKKVFPALPVSCTGHQISQLPFFCAMVWNLTHPPPPFFWKLHSTVSGIILTLYISHHKQRLVLLS